MEDFLHTMISFVAVNSWLDEVEVIFFPITFIRNAIASMGKM